MATLRYAARTQPGIHHRSNQDAVLVHGRVHQQPWHGSGVLEGELLLVAVADGVSTSPSPATASRTVLEALRASVEREPQRPVRHHVNDVHERLCTIATRVQRGMASTLAAVLVRGPRVTVFHSGDSRVYQLTAGQAQVLTKDHTALQGMLDRGEITPAQARTAASVYSSLEHCFVADSFAEPPKVSVRQIDLLPGTSLLLCTDGLTGAVDAASLGMVQGSPAERVEALVRMALDRGSEDDITVVLLEG